MDVLNTALVVGSLWVDEETSVVDWLEVLVILFDEVILEAVDEVAGVERALRVEETMERDGRAVLVCLVDSELSVCR